MKEFSMKKLLVILLALTLLGGCSLMCKEGEVGKKVLQGIIGNGNGLIQVIMAQYPNC
jgi:hypothetical protein